MKKSTHKGTCQVCGSVQKVQNNGTNNLFAHGYTKRDGWWNNDECFGSNSKALEVSCSKVIESQRLARIKRNKLLNDQDAQKNGDAPVKTVFRIYSKKYWTVIEYLSTLHSTEERDGYILATWLRNDGEEQTTKEYTSLKGFEQKYRDTEIKNLQRTIDTIGRYINTQQEVLDNWVAKPLINIK